MKHPLLAAVLVLLTLLTGVCLRAAEAVAPRERVLLNDGWRFYKGDPQWMSPQFDYTAIKPWILPSATPMLGATSPKLARPAGNLGGDLECVRTEYNDSGWRELNLPHDWGIEGPFGQHIPGDGGKLPWAGTGWYWRSTAPWLVRWCG
jgi:beta-galactosidase